MAIHKRPVETILVAKAGTTLLADGATTLADSATGHINLADGQLGIFTAEGANNNVAVDSAAYGAVAKKIRFVQGTADSDNPNGIMFAGMSVRTHEKTGPIDKTQINYATKQAYVAPRLNGWTVENVNVVDETAYALNIAFRGRRMDEKYGVSITHSISPEYVSGVGATEAQIVNGVVNATNSFSKLNNAVRVNARENVIAFSIFTTPGAAVDGIAINSAAGTPTGYYGVALDAQMVTALAAIVADTDNSIVATSRIVPAGNANADAIVVLALDEDLAYHDRIMPVKTRIDLGLLRGFNINTVVVNESSLTREAERSTRAWKIYYDGTFGQRKHSQYRGFDDIKIELPNYLEDGVTYNAYVVEHTRSQQVGVADVSISPEKLVILVPSTDGALNTAVEEAIEGIFGVTI